jgi:site-specific DNA-methyltransferase (adenine-specific)
MNAKKKAAPAPPTPPTPVIRSAKLSSLKQDPQNANRGTPRGQDLLERSIREYGAGRSIVLDKHGVILAGNKTQINAAKAGLKDVLIVKTDGTQLVAVQRMDLDHKEKRGKEYAVSDNRVAEVDLAWDQAVLAELDIDLAAFFTDEEFAGLAPEVELPVLLTDPDDVPDAPADPVSKPGDLYQLGKHRLLCGDSTNQSDVDRLMDGAKAHCMWTDPPYGVSYVGKTKRALTIKNDGAVDLATLLEAAFACAQSALLPGSPIYVAHPPGALSVTFGNAFLAAGWRLHQTLVWDKGTMVMGHSDYHYSHEPIFYGYTPGQGRTGRGGKNWYGDNSQISVLAFPKPSRSETHPTMKPLALVEHCLKNSSRPEDLVLDLFAGSGSTLMACETTGRACRTIELDPAYVDVIVARYEASTGQKAVKVGGHGKKA